MSSVKIVNSTFICKLIMSKMGFPMLIKISSVFILFAIVSSILCGRVEPMLSAFFGGSSDAISYCLNICGSICFFSGLMRVAEASGLTGKVADGLRPLVRRMVPSALVNTETEMSVVMNLSSNLFGLGNAATPFGIKAARNMYTLNGLKSPDRSFATFMVLNTSSLCLIPSTAIALRQAYGSVSPSDILLPVVTVQLLSCVFGIILVRLVFGR